jgi:hypothetical protein
MAEAPWRHIPREFCSHPYLWLPVVVTLLKGVIWRAVISPAQAPDGWSRVSRIRFMPSSDGCLGRANRARAMNSAR